MTIYIKVPHSIDQTAFQARYLELSGEVYVWDNLCNAAETHCMSGSSRLTQTDADTLKSEYPTIETFNEFPSTDDWEPE